jgi:hypothetical protein
MSVRTRKEGGIQVACGCATRDVEAEAKVLDMFATAGLREIVERTQEANRVMIESIRHLDKADRAAALGFGEDVVALHRSAGERANRWCRRQFGTVIEAIDNRVGRDDWSDLVARAQHEFDAHEGRLQLEDAAAELRARLLDLDRLPVTAGRLASIIDQAFERVASEGLSGGMQLLRENLEEGVKVLSAPEMGRQEASPDDAAYVICCAGVTAICVIATALCMGIYFCWCCYWWVILLACLAAIGSCAGLLYT